MVDSPLGALIIATMDVAVSLPSTAAAALLVYPDAPNRHVIPRGGNQDIVTETIVITAFGHP